MENKIPSVNNLVKKTDYNTTEITEIENKLTNHNHDKYSDTSEFNKLAIDVFNARIRQANLITKTDLDAKLSGLKRKITQNKIKHLLVANRWTTLENKIPDVSGLVKKTDYNTKVSEIDIKVSTLDGKITKNIINTTTTINLLFLRTLMFDGEDGYQAYLIFQPGYKYFKFITNTNYISSWKSKGLSAKSIKPFPTSDNSLIPLITYYDYNIRLKFNGSVLRQPNVTYNHGKVVNIYIVYKLTESSSNDDDPTLKNCLFGAVTLTKNTDIDRYGYSSYWIGFDRRGSFSFPGGEYGQNVLIFRADMSSSAHTDNKKDILVLGIGPTQGLENALTPEKMYSINFTEKDKKFCLSLHYNGTNSYLFVNGKEIIKFKAKDSEITASPICLGNILKGWSIDNMKKRTKWICLRI